MSTRGTSLRHIPDWRTYAACLSVKPDTMFPAPGEKDAIDYAQSICARCPVRLKCLEFALADEGGKTKDMRHGIAGGLTPNQRYNEYNRRRTTAPGYVPPPPRKVGTRPPAPCGTPSAYDRHIRNGEPIDDACREAHNAKRRQFKTKARGPAECGTRRGYQKHRRDGETACDACRQANTDADNRLRRTGTTKVMA